MTEDQRWLEIRRGVYRDSVTLLRVSRRLTERDGVHGALAAMATELNIELLDGMGFPVSGDTGPNDLVIAIRAADEAALTAARDELDQLLTGPGAQEPVGAGGLGGAPAARTVGSAAAREGGGSRATLALISVPGAHACAESLDALGAGLNVMVFSDNVPVAHEIALKEEAARRGLLVMGPDCGTAVIGGVGLGFANVVRPGPVGIVAASGTGAQQVMSLLDLAGVGVSHVLGVGGRDLSAEVSGRSTLQALAALDADPATELILIVSKPPAAAVSDLVREAVRRLATPTVYAPLGPGQDDLTAVAERVVTMTGGVVPTWPCWPAPRPQHASGGALRGLFVGGTLCQEAMLIATQVLGPVRSNVPLRADWALGGAAPVTGPADTETEAGTDTGTGTNAATGTATDADPEPRHMMMDFGDDTLTGGRAHPMIDGTLRLERLAVEAADPGCGVLLLDVVLGNAAEPDPCATLAPAIEAARRRGPAVVVSLCGTAADPQGLVHQATALQAAGAAVFTSNAAAARHAVALIKGS